MAKAEAKQEVPKRPIQLQKDIQGVGYRKGVGLALDDESEHQPWFLNRVIMPQCKDM